MYAVIQTGGKQYRVSEGQVLTVEKLDVEIGKTVEFNNVLMLSNDAGLKVGAPFVDCHAKNIALLYTSRADVHLAPVYDMLTTSVYAGYQNNPPGIGFMGKKTWAPGKTLQKFIAATFGIALKEQLQIVEAIGQAVSEVAPAVRAAMVEHPGFADIGKRMLQTWEAGVTGLRDKRVYALGDAVSTKAALGDAFGGFSDPPKLKAEKPVVGRSELLGRRK